MTNLAWIDLETTGLEPNHTNGLLLEAALVITDWDLNVLWQGSWVASHSTVNLTSFDPGVVDMHSKNGLWGDVVQSKTAVSAIESQMVEVLRSAELFPDLEPRPLLAGSSISFERQWLRYWMPKVLKELHYRSVDVSSFKEVVQNRFIEQDWFASENTKDHRALSDIHASIDELSYYFTLLDLPKPIR